MAALPALQRAWIIAAAVLGTLLVAGSATGLVMRAVSGSEPGGAPRRTTAWVTATDDATRSASPTATPSGSASAAVVTTAGAAATEVPAFQRAATIAFRRNGSVWVADERGTQARSIAVSADGIFALSPDGLSLALVDAATGQLSVRAVSTGAAVIVGPATQALPVWSPDSAWFIYRRESDQGGELVRVSRDGQQPRVLGLGISASITPDAVWVFCVRADAGGSGRIARVPSSGGPPVLMPPDSAVLGVSEVAVDGTRVVFVEAGSGGPPSAIRSMTWAGADVRPLVARPLTATDVTLTGLRPSPDGAWLAYQESGDDGYSRILCVRVQGGEPTRLSLRYDAYVIGWSVAGTELLFAEGNTLQGETSRIMAVRPDGSGRRVVADSAGL